MKVYCKNDNKMHSKTELAHATIYWHDCCLTPLYACHVIVKRDMKHDDD